MIYCQVKDGLVVNRVVFDAAMPTDWPEYETYVQDDVAQIGWIYVDGVFTPPEPHIETPPPLSTQPETAVLYDHENRIRAIEGQPPMSMGDFIETNNPTARPPPS
jgi:hypothetical protein